MKRLIVLVCVVSLLCGCAVESGPQNQRYTATFLDLFDTVTTVVGFAESEEAFQTLAQDVQNRLRKYHQLFDIYNTYDGLHNLKTVNDQAGIAPVQVDAEVIRLLQDCISYYELTDGRVNVAFGSVLQLWHNAREDAFNDPTAARVPEEPFLQEAAAHADIRAIVIDEAASTVFLSDPNVRLDVGAVAKGWAAQRVCESVPEGLLISVGGNVCATGPKPDGAAWVIGIQNPDKADSYLHTLSISRGNVVTSGDYQRSFTLDGKLYHHIIDPDTLYPGTLWRSVSVVCADSGLADALSTALFLLPQAQGQALLDACDAQAMWVNDQGEIFYSSGFEALIRT